jgi:hypothetical protein
MFTLLQHGIYEELRWLKAVLEATDNSADY